MKTEPQWSDADGFYELLLDAHQGLSSAQSEVLNARLILLLANQIGDEAILAQCIDAARNMPDVGHSKLTGNNSYYKYS